LKSSRANFFDRIVGITSSSFAGIYRIGRLRHAFTASFETLQIASTIVTISLIDVAARSADFWVSSATTAN
jgi:hypothetical protein